MTLNNILSIGALVLLLTTASGCASTSKSQTVDTQAADSAITAKVQAAANDDASLNSSSMVVETAKGVVRLSGTVASHVEMAKAREIARGVDGVASVTNDMMVKTVR